MKSVWVGVCLLAACSFDVPGPEPGEARSDTCSGLSDADPGLDDGVYQLEPADAEPYDAFCDMTRRGGGWTLAMKIDGSIATNMSQFGFDSSAWTDSDAINPESADLDASEAKLASFHRVAATEILLQFDWLSGESELVVASFTGGAQIDSLRSLFENGIPAGATMLPGPEVWDSAAPAVSLQGGCQGTEVNFPAGWNGARLAALGDNEDCETEGDGWHSPDSRIGIGLGGSMQGPSAGGKNAANGNEEAAFVYVFVR